MAASDVIDHRSARRRAWDILWITLPIAGQNRLEFPQKARTACRSRPFPRVRFRRVYALHHLATFWSGVRRKFPALTARGRSRNEVLQSRTGAQAVNILKMRVERQQRGAVLQATGGNPQIVGGNGLSSAAQCGIDQCIQIGCGRSQNNGSGARRRAAKP